MFIFELLEKIFDPPPLNSFLATQEIIVCFRGAMPVPSLVKEKKENIKRPI